MKFDRFIIILPGMSKHYGSRKAGDFLYREAHKAFIYQGTEFPLEKFNGIVPKVVEVNRNFTAELPFVKLLEAEVETPPAEAEIELSQGPDSLFNEDDLGLLERLHADTLTAEDVNHLTERCLASGFPVGPPASPAPTEPVPPPPSPSLPDSPAPAVSEEGSGKGSSESEAAGSPPAAEDAVKTTTETIAPDGVTQSTAPAPPAKKAPTKKTTTKQAAPKPKAKDDDQAAP